MLHAFMQDAAMVGQHVAKYGTKLDSRTREILRETIDRDVRLFQPILTEFEKHAPDVVPEAKRELAVIRKLRASLEN